jgi:hypothetical protein
MNKFEFRRFTLQKKIPIISFKIPIIHFIAAYDWGERVGSDAEERLKTSATSAATTA